VTEDGAYQEYLLTKKGLDLFLVTVSLRQWGEDHCFAKDEQHSILVETKSGRRIEPLELRSKDGRLIDASATHVRKIPDHIGATARTNQA